MSKIKKTMAVFAIAAGMCALPVASTTCCAQEATAGLTTADGKAVDANAAAKSDSKGGGFYDIVFGSGIVGMLLWFALFGDGILAIYFCIDSSILIKP